MSEIGNFSDCLVLKIEERRNKRDDELMTTLFILYDEDLNKFVVRGKADERSSYHYSFVCESASDLADFVSVVICKRSRWTFVLYSIDNLPETSNEITYNVLDYLCIRPNEIAGYNCLKYNRNYLTDMLRILRNVYNPMC